MKRFAHFFGFLSGVLLGLGVTSLAIKLLSTFKIVDVYTQLNLAVIIAIYALITAICIILCISVSVPVLESIKKSTKKIENLFSTVPTSVLVFSVIGLIIGLIIALLVSQLFAFLPWPWLKWTLSVITYLFCGYVGVVLANQRKTEITTTFIPKRTEKFEKIERKEKYQNPKILDTSVVIDGRILEILRSGFLEGTMIISDLILHELRHIADASEYNKRNRGRRGLDILKIMQEEFKNSIVVVDTSGKYPDVKDVDEKLVYLTRDLKGKIITNDYNLNKMAKVQKVQVLNVNELAQAIKLNIMTGEVLRLNIIKKGTEDGQGVAYLDDGTMIVVENGEEALGKEIMAEVTSVIQTVSGRMIFATSLDYRQQTFL